MSRSLRNSTLGAILLTAISGCAANAHKYASLRADLIVEGKITSRAAFDVMEGDVAVIWSRYVLQTRQEPHDSIEFVSEYPCPAPSSADQLYLVLLNRWSFYSGEGKTIHLRVLRCAKLDDPGR